MANPLGEKRSEGEGRTSITFNDQEVTNPVLRAIVGALALIGGMLGVVLALMVLAIVVPLSLPVHLVLRLLGRRGFVEHYEGGTFSYSVSEQGFKKEEA